MKQSKSSAILSSHGWGLRRYSDGKIVVTHKDGSGTVLREGTEKNDVKIIESLFYRMMDDFLCDS